MEVRAVFELPVPIWVMCDAFDATYQSGFGRVRFDVVMPRADGPNGAAPRVAGIAERDDLSNDDVMWVHEYGGFIPESLRPATALHRVAIVNVEAPTIEGQEYRTPDVQLAEAVAGWFDYVRTWAEVLTGQDLDPNHRVYDAESIGGGLTFIEPPSDGARGLRITTPSLRPLRSGEWAGILQLVRAGKEPPLEELLSRDARASQRRNAHRRAIIEAATAVEIVLGRYVQSRARQLPEKQRKRINSRTALGDFIAIAADSKLPLAVPPERLRSLNKLRNDAAHRGQAPGSWDAAMAVQTMIDFLGVHGEYRRSEEREPDGSEWVIADAEPESTAAES